MKLGRIVAGLMLLAGLAAVAGATDPGAIIFRRVATYLDAGVVAARNDQFLSVNPARKVDRVLVEKSRHTLTLFAGDMPVRVYQVALGRGGMEPKSREGDNRVPEGRYTLDWRNAQSGYHRALHVSYPDQKDRADAASRGVSPGGDIMVHGIRNRLGWIGSLHRLMDWTAGCVAVTNTEIEEIWALVPDGTPIEIKP